MEIPRILLAGTGSRVGKTVISIGLMRALRNRGLRVQPFKVGPDFIDPSYHRFATGRHSRNLDGFLMGREGIQEAFQRNARGAEIAVIEGTMGFYDSHDALREEGSTAEVAKVLRSPVLLIANVERISRTAAALVLGYKLFDREVDLRGVLLNRVGRERHASKVRRAVEGLTDLEVVGVLPRSEILRIPERHMGLVTAYEEPHLEELFNAFAAFAEEHIDIDRILEIARGAPPLEEVEEHPLYHPEERYRVRLGVVRDRVFSFYYQDLLDAFEAAGARIKIIDSLRDEDLPPIDALYIGGGFPEVFAQGLEENLPLREAVREFCSEGGTTYAECGGLMYLGRALRTESQEREMAGFLPLKTIMGGRYFLGYAVARSLRRTPATGAGDRLVGHHFHYSRVEPLEELSYVYRMERGSGVAGRRDGILLEEALATYLHLHPLSYPPLVENLLRSAG
jgi:cobyrinic acid a,c-diamide synthase